MPDSIRTVLDLPWMNTVLGLALLAVIAFVAYIISRRVLLRVIRAVTQRTAWTWDDALEKHGMFTRLAQMVPTLVLQFGIGLVPGIPDEIDTLVRNVALALTVLFALLSLNAVLNALEDLYQASPSGRHRSIKGYVQLIKIILFVIGAIVIIASLINRSPLLLLSGLGAVSAVLLLVFKDTILSLVASVQLASNDMLRVGDWISMPSANADGDVIDVALHTVKVQNWDKTISTIPTWRLISESFQNWRGMQQAGGRRIKRALHIDATRVGYLDDDDLARLRKSRLLDEYLQRKHADIDKWNSALGEPGQAPINQRRLTNLGTFRAYAQAYIEAHPDIHPSMTRMVRVLEPGPQGIPVEIYCFTKTTEWADYERIQADIFDHLITILPEFDLALYQQPSGRDFAGLARDAQAMHDESTQGP
ncbi:MAG: mechanosensitive ion channel domain-containing protein [Rhodanobacteraceae bacterium]